MLNTLKVAIIGIVLATILGTLIGIGRLSKNWLLAKLTAFYVETLRDIPLLLQLLFWYTFLQGLPAPRQAWHIGTFAFLTNRGMRLPRWTGNPPIPGPCWPSSSAPIGTCCGTVAPTASRRRPASARRLAGRAGAADRSAARRLGRARRAVHRSTARRCAASTSRAA